MEISQRLLSEIQPYPKNAKKHPEKQVKQVANSIREFGFNQPIVVDKAGVIVVGHGRYEAAKLLEMETVPVLEIDVTEQQANAYRLADNKLNESEWDMGLVLEELKELKIEGFDVELTGFDPVIIEEKTPGEPGEQQESTKEKITCPNCQHRFTHSCRENVEAENNANETMEELGEDIEV